MLVSGLLSIGCVFNSLVSVVLSGSSESVVDVGCREWNSSQSLPGVVIGGSE